MITLGKCVKTSMFVTEVKAVNLCQESRDMETCTCEEVVHN